MTNDVESLMLGRLQPALASSSALNPLYPPLLGEFFMDLFPSYSLPSRKGGLESIANLSLREMAVAIVDVHSLLDREARYSITAYSEP